MQNARKGKGKQGEKGRNMTQEGSKGQRGPKRPKPKPRDQNSWIADNLKGKI